MAPIELARSFQLQICAASRSGLQMDDANKRGQCGVSWTRQQAQLGTWTSSTEPGKTSQLGDCEGTANSNTLLIGPVRPDEHLLFMTERRTFSEVLSSGWTCQDA